MSFARVRALVIVGAFFIVAAVLVGVAMLRDTQAKAPVVAGCPEGYVQANVKLPEPREVKINVYNATDTEDLAAQVAADFANRKFQVKKHGNDPKGKAVTGVALLRYGPKAVGAAHLLRAYFLDRAKTEYDVRRADDVVDVVLGAQFQQIGTTTEVNQSLAAIGNPEAPPGACPADG